MLAMFLKKITEEDVYALIEVITKHYIVLSNEVDRKTHMGFCG